MNPIEYEEKMKAFRDQLNAVTKDIQAIADHFANGAFESHPVPYSNPDLQRLRDQLLSQSQDALDAMIELHKKFNSVK